MVDFSALPVYRPFEEQLASLPAERRRAYHELLAIAAAEFPRLLAAGPSLSPFSCGGGGTVLAPLMLLRFLRCSPGPVKFDVASAAKLMRSYAVWAERTRVHSARAVDLLHALGRGAVVAPGIKTPEGWEIVLLRPARFRPRRDSLNAFLRALVYTLSAVTKDEYNCSTGIAIIADVAGFGYSNFSVAYARTFLATLQSRFPMRVRTFSIVNAPGWFATVWRVLRPMMKKESAARVHFPKGREALTAFFASDDHLPSNLGGNLDVDSRFAKWLAWRHRIENTPEVEVVAAIERGLDLIDADQDVAAGPVAG